MRDVCRALLAQGGGLRLTDGAVECGGKGPRTRTVRLLGAGAQQPALGLRRFSRSAAARGKTEHRETTLVLPDRFRHVEMTSEQPRGTGIVPAAQRVDCTPLNTARKDGKVRQDAHSSGLSDAETVQQITDAARSVRRASGRRHDRRPSAGRRGRRPMSRTGTVGVSIHKKCSLFLKSDLSAVSVYAVRTSRCNIIRKKPAGFTADVNRQAFLLAVMLFPAWRCRCGNTCGRPPCSFGTCRRR